MPLFAIIGFFIAVLVVGAAVLVLIAEVYIVIIGHWKGAPFVRSKREKIKTMLELAQIKQREQVVDLGSGDGTLLFEAARKGARPIGLEINPFLVFYSRLRARRLKLSIEVFWRDFRDYPLNAADVVFVYLWPSTLENLKDKFERELRPGTRVISNAFSIKGWSPTKELDGVFLYHKL